ncbi:MAG: hypothetical protein HY720_01365 [Planctomycetes bacterium]|nr:hypothetical protein [Planctomycetota bacterium]
MAKRTEASPFNISFLDILSCALGGLLFILIFFLLQSALTEPDTSEADAAAERDRQEREALRKERENLTTELDLLRSRTAEKRAEAEKRAAESAQARAAFDSLRQAQTETQKVEQMRELADLEAARLRRRIEEVREEVKTLSDRSKVSVVKFLPRQGGGGSAGQVHHVVVSGEELVLYPGKEKVPVKNALDAGSKYRKLLERLASDRDRAMILWFRPSGFEHFQAIASAAIEAEVRFGWEPADEDWNIGEE